MEGWQAWDHRAGPLPVTMGDRKTNRQGLITANDWIKHGCETDSLGFHRGAKTANKSSAHPSVLQPYAGGPEREALLREEMPLFWALGL